MRRIRLLVIGIVAAAVLSGCTFVPTDSSPQVIPSRSVPFHLLSKHHPAAHRAAHR